MAVQLWLLCTGFAIAFPALFVKTWRIAKIIEAGRSLRRIKIRERDCLVAIGMWVLGIAHSAADEAFFFISLTICSDRDSCMPGVGVDCADGLAPV